MDGYISKEALIKNTMGVLGVFFVILFVTQFPELRRYLKIRSM